MCACLLALLLVGCSGAGGESEPTGTAPTSTAQQRTAAAQQAMGRLAAAVAETDRGAWEAVIADADPSFGSTASMAYANLAGLDARLDVQVSGRTADLSAERRELLGPDAWPAAVTVSWSIGDQPPTVHQLWFTFVADEEGVRWAGIGDAPDEDRLAATPLWLVESVEPVYTDHVLAVVGSGPDNPRAWVESAEQSVVDVLDTIGPEAVVPQSGGLVQLQVPSSQSGMERVLGEPPGSLDQVAGITWSAGAKDSDGPYPIVLNPVQLAKLSSEGVSVLIAHEATHSVTGAVQGDGPLWLEEGFADLVAFRIHPAATTASTEAVRASVRTDGPPEQLPEVTRGDDPEALGLEYALAWSLCHHLAAGHSFTDVVALHTAVQSGDDIGAALAALGLDAESLLVGWQEWLVEWSR
ncbi:MAG: hypothetical protein ACTH2Q_06500 [Propionibacteriaceae bacterium]